MSGSQVATSSSELQYAIYGFNAISLTNWTTSAASVIAAGSQVEVAGAFFTYSGNDTNDATSFSAITTGATAYLQLVPSGTAGSQIVTSSWTSTAPTWRTDKNGWYASAGSNIRAVAGCVKTGASSYERKFIQGDRGALRNIQDIALPIGFIYTQLPGMTAPDTLWPWASWTNISSTFAGDFFRAEGGAASAFESGEQAHQFQDHIHGLTPEDNVTSAGGGAATAFLISSANLPANITTTAPTSGNHGSETRPVNRTVRVWQRIS